MMEAWLITPPEKFTVISLPNLELEVEHRHITKRKKVSDQTENTKQV